MVTKPSTSKRFLFFIFYLTGTVYDMQPYQN